MSQELPKRAPHEPPIDGPHEIVGQPGITHHYVFAGPNARKRDDSTTGQPVTQEDLAPLAASLTTPRPLPVWRRALNDFVGAFAGLTAIITAGLLALEYGQLTLASRLACGGITVLVAAGFAVRHKRRRKVRH